MTLWGELDLHLFNEGSHLRLWEKLGSHPGPGGTVFSVWAPNAGQVSVVGDFNGWREGVHPLHPLGTSGVWEGEVAQAHPGSVYKYRIRGQDGQVRDKADPVAFHAETAPRTASIVWRSGHRWRDEAWMAARPGKDPSREPWSMYEIHLGSWRYGLGYRQAAEPLAEHALRMGFTHVELMPLMEHPYYASWGYQATGYFAPTSRYGTPDDLMYLIDHLHQQGIGVVLDWVPSHFATDAHGLGLFDGTHLYEHADPRRGFHPDWKSYVFNFGRHEVRSFLLSSALYWLELYHADALRVDAVASMLYLDYSRPPGSWVPNRLGGREDLEAVDFLRRLNQEVRARQPGAVTIAEESTFWPKVSRPVDEGGLGFGMKWDLGWMHDTLDHFHRDPVHRRYHPKELSFRSLYAFSEDFVLPLSHDEVVHGKGSLLAKMPGDTWQRFANLRLLFGLMFTTPGKKLLFMGSELAPWREWSHEEELPWQLGKEPLHAGVGRWLADLNRLYRSAPELFATDFDPQGFRWLDAGDSGNSIVAFAREFAGTEIIAVANLTPVARGGYQLGVGEAGFWHEILNSDSHHYGGGGVGNLGGLEAGGPSGGRPHSLQVMLPPLGIVVLARRPIL